MTDSVGFEMDCGATTLIDAADLPLLVGRRWRIRRDRNKVYAQARGRKGDPVQVIYLHRVLLGITDRHIEVDHKNGDGLDNRRWNLRICTKSQNQANRGLSKANTSGFKGVHRRGNSWAASIRKDRRTNRLGVFDTREQAAEAYDQAAMQLHGEFARLNFPGRSQPIA